MQYNILFIYILRYRLYLIKIKNQAKKIKLKKNLFSKEYIICSTEESLPLITL